MSEVLRFVLMVILFWEVYRMGKCHDNKDIVGTLYYGFSSLLTMILWIAGYFMPWNILSSFPTPTSLTSKSA